uniref:Uncharacterized protein n=1 Tax=Rhodopseudomonas palustris (strain BisA53) TaxID=316055 RepID=Q07TL8_RHOP5
MRKMDAAMLDDKTAATLEEIRARVYYALQRHPLCRRVKFDVLQTPRSRKGVNWTVAMQAVEPDALWEASAIVADIQDAYELANAA